MLHDTDIKQPFEYLHITYKTNCNAKQISKVQDRKSYIALSKYVTDKAHRLNASRQRLYLLLKVVLHISSVMMVAAFCYDKTILSLDIS